MVVSVPGLETLRELRVPVERTAVEIETEVERCAAVIFLPPGGRPEEVLEAEGAFFPAEVSGEIRMFARGSVVRVVVDGECAPASLAAVGVRCESYAVVVRFKAGAPLTGVVMSLSGAARLLEVLDERSKSFAVHADGKIHHVAKQHVAWVEELR